MSPTAYRLQRLTALILAPMVAIHLGLIIFAVQGGLTGEEILSRTRGGFGMAWAGFYGVFVLAAALHGSIGLAQIVREWGLLASKQAGILMAGCFFLFAALGLRAVMVML